MYASTSADFFIVEVEVDLPALAIL